MKKRTRTILFASFVAFFILVTPILVLYAQGYRFDFEKFQIVETGAIFVQARPYPLDIILDSEDKTRTSFLFRNTFKSNLLPDSYVVDIQKEDYHPWRKELSVEAGLVTETSNVTLFPTDPLTTEVQLNISSVFHAPDQNTSIVTFDNKIGLYVREENEVLQIASLLYGETIRDVIWSHDNTRPLIVLERSRANPRLLIGSTVSPRTFSFVTIPSSRILSAIRTNNTRWQWSNDGLLLYVAITEGFYEGEPTRAIYSIDLVQKKITGPLLARIQDFRVFPNGIMVLEANGSLIEYSHVFKNKETIVAGSLRTPTNDARLLGTNDTLLLHEDMSLYIFDKNQEGFVLIDKNVSYPLLATDNKKVVFAKDDSLFLYWIEDTISGYTRLTGDKETLMTYQGKLAGLSWLFSPFQYLAIATDQGLTIAEIDTRDQVNIVQYPDFASTSPISWNRKKESLLVLTDGTLQEISLTRPVEVVQDEES